jgi:hypothetical protein
VLVLATGLTAVLAPRAMEAAMKRDIPAARHTRNVYLLVMTSGGLIYLAVSAAPWVLNPMQYIVPDAYDVEWLVAATVFANLVAAIMYIDINELLGAQKARAMAAIAIITSPILVLVAFTASTTQAFARTFGHGARDVIQVAWYRSTLNKHYAAGREPATTRR